MKKSDFTAFEPFFSHSENWGDLERINWLIPWMCYQIRWAMKRTGLEWPIIINCAFETEGHSPNSYHYKGLAVDFHFKTLHQNFMHQYVSLENALESLKLDRFVGFGAYPQWNTPGFHLDLRGVSMRWIKVNDLGYKYGNAMEIKKLLFKY